MPKFIGLHLLRFDALRDRPALAANLPPGTLFCNIAADTRAAATEPTSSQAYVFACLSLHTDLAAAQSFLAARTALIPAVLDARESYAAILQPFRHHGSVNWLNPTNPDALFPELAPTPASDQPMVAITTAGYSDFSNPERMRLFSLGVAAVRMSMTGTSGLHSQQTFFFPGGLAIDPVTITFWRDQEAIKSFSYGPGVHRTQLDKHRSENLADRTSFTRAQILQSEGSWYGCDPQTTFRD